MLSTVHPLAEQVLQEWLTGGLAVSRLDDIRGMLTELGVDMTDSSHLRQYTPFLHGEEILRIKTEMSGQFYSVCFDGSPIFHQVRAACFTCKLR